MADAKSSKKKQRRSVPAGQLHIQATFNNTIVTFSDKKGNVLTATASAGACGFHGSKKGTAYASQVAAEKAAEVAKSQYGLKSVDVFVKGVGLVMTLRSVPLAHLISQLRVSSDVTGVPHGGVRPRKARRV